MNYNGFDVYKTYLAIKLHFTTTAYDYHKYNGKVNASLEQFTRRNDRYFFYKLSNRYAKDSIVDYFVSNFASNNKKWIGNLLEDDGHKIYLRYRKYSESLNYNLRNDIGRVIYDFNKRGINFDSGMGVHNGQHPRMLRLLIQEKINYQTAIILDKAIAFIKDWDTQIKEKVVWPNISTKLKKLKPFLRYNEVEAQLILKETIREGFQNEN
jgi:hypothetical protein